VAQYWLQTPIENAKEVVQRFVDANASIVTGLAGKTVSYTELTEVIYYAGQIPSLPFNNNEILFGTWYLASSEANASFVLTDGVVSLATFDPSAGGSPTEPGHYPYIIWNEMAIQPNEPAYFVGYKFKLL